MSLISEIILYSTDFEYVVVAYFYRYTHDGRNISEETTQLKGKIAATEKELAEVQELCAAKKGPRGQRHQQRLTTLTADLDELNSQLAELKQLPLINNLARKTAANNKQYAVRLIRAHKRTG